MIEICERCKRDLDPGKIIWLELDQRYLVYHDFGDVPNSLSQGCFPFGPDCAKKERAKARAAMRRLG